MVQYPVMFFFHSVDPFLTFSQLPERELLLISLMVTDSALAKISDTATTMSDITDLLYVINPRPCDSAIGTTAIPVTTL